MLFIFTTPKAHSVAIGHRPDYVSDNKEEIIRTQEEKDMWEPIGEKAWPLRMAIPAKLRFIGRGYMWGCTVGVTAFMIFTIANSIVGG